MNITWSLCAIFLDERKNDTPAGNQEGLGRVMVSQAHHGSGISGLFKQDNFSCAFSDTDYIVQSKILDGQIVAP